MKYLIIYNPDEIMSITPVNGAEILSTQNMVVAELDEARIMLSVLGYDVEKIDNYNSEDDVDFEEIEETPETEEL